MKTIVFIYLLDKTIWINMQIHWKKVAFIENTPVTLGCQKCSLLWHSIVNLNISLLIPFCIMLFTCFQTAIQSFVFAVVFMKQHEMQEYKGEESSSAIHSCLAKYSVCEHHHYVFLWLSGRALH